MAKRQLSLFENQRLDLEGAIELSLLSLQSYGRRYRHWSVAYSGGKDSSATIAFVAWAIKSGMVEAPESLSVLYADTRMELPPLQQTAMRLLGQLQADGFDARVVMPPLDDRFFVYMLGRGVPPPKNRFRWCTSQLKIMPMMFALEDKAVGYGYGEIIPTSRNRYGREYRGFGQDKLLAITGVRLGESKARDQRIALSCSTTGECGQGMLHDDDPNNVGEDHAGWFQPSPPTAVYDTLAPVIHWRLCHVFDWLYFDDRHGYDISKIAAVYGEDDIRTGCVGCNLASRDNALERLIRDPNWAHLSPLLELKPLYKELTKAKWRLRKGEAEYRKDGQLVKNPNRLGPLTFEARLMGLEAVLDIQARAQVDLINPEEARRIRELIAAETWPNGWSGDEVVGSQPIDLIMADGSIQGLLVR